MKSEFKVIPLTKRRKGAIVRKRAAQIRKKRKAAATTSVSKIPSVILNINEAKPKSSTKTRKPKRVYRAVRRAPAKRKYYIKKPSNYAGFVNRLYDQASLSGINRMYGQMINPKPLRQSLINILESLKNG